MFGSSGVFTRQKLEVYRFRLHDLRHTTASWLVQQGRSLREVKELLGHSDITTTTIYTHVARERLKQLHARHHPRG